MVREGWGIQESPDVPAIHWWEMFQKAGHLLAFLSMFEEDGESRVAAASWNFKATEIQQVTIKPQPDFE